MISEEEKEAIEYLKNRLEILHNNTQWETEKSIKVVLNLIEKQQQEIEEIKNANKELKNSLIDMVNQFAYDIKRKKYENERLYTGGLSALERAFDVLNIDEEIKRKDLWKLLEEN